ncbi:MAG TPA: hypothetical protein DCM87_15185 [Planctomycetes bacterium]|nr:hypothetical protein [Planctomycetota bacterium]
MDVRLDDGRIEVVDDSVAEILRRKTPAERIAMIGDANRTMRSVIAAHIRSLHPEWDAQAVLAEVARRMSDGAA